MAMGSARGTASPTAAGSGGIASASACGRDSSVSTTLAKINVTP